LPTPPFWLEKQIILPIIAPFLLNKTKICPQQNNDTTVLDFFQHNVATNTVFAQTLTNI